MLLQKAEWPCLLITPTTSTNSKVKKLISTATFLYVDLFTSLFTCKMGIYSIFPASTQPLNKGWFSLRAIRSLETGYSPGDGRQGSLEP